MNRPRSLFDAWNLYQEEIQATQSRQQAKATLAQAKTALLRYTLPGWGFLIPHRSKLTEQEMEAALSYTKQVSLEQLSNGRYIQQTVFEALQVPINSQRNYRAALNKLLKWCEQQSWWQNVATEQQSTLHKPKPSVLDIRVTNRKYKDEQGKLLQEYKYGLGSVAVDEIPNRLQRELKAFQRFRTNSEGSNRKQEVKQSTVDKDLKHIRLILGWLHRIRGIPLEQLSLNQIVPLVLLKSTQEREAEMVKAGHAAAQQALTLAEDYIKWLKTSPEAERPEARGRGIESTYTETSVLNTVLLVAEFIYRQESESNQRVRAKDNSVVELIRQQTSAVRKTIKERHEQSDCSKEMIEWTEFLAVVEQLRQECQPKLVRSGSLLKDDSSFVGSRPLSAIAYSYQCFLLAAFMSYIPPQRQQIYRNLRIPYPGASRQKFSFGSQEQGEREDRKDITFLDLLEENSTTKVENEEYPLVPAESSGYLYREAELWHIHLFPDKYKTGKNYEDLAVKIPNLHYADGRCFYQYLEEWLFEYTYQSKRGVIKKVEGLRQIFHPQHEYFFTQKEGERYSHPTNFSNLLRVPAYRIIGKVMTLDLLREIFAKYILKFSSDNNTTAQIAQLKHIYWIRGENYDVWADIRTVALSRQIAEEVSQFFGDKTV